MNCKHDYKETGTCAWTGIDGEREVEKIYSVKECLNCHDIIEERVK